MPKVAFAVTLLTSSMLTVLAKAYIANIEDVTRRVGDVRRAFSLVRENVIEGGDPAAPSSTATLLRLHHGCRPKLGHRFPKRLN